MNFGVETTPVSGGSVALRFAPVVPAVEVALVRVQQLGAQRELGAQVHGVAEVLAHELRGGRGIRSVWGHAPRTTRGAPRTAPRRGERFPHLHDPLPVRPRGVRLWVARDRVLRHAQLDGEGVAHRCGVGVGAPRVAGEQALPPVIPQAVHVGVQRQQLPVQLEGGRAPVARGALRRVNGRQG